VAARVVTSGVASGEDTGPPGVPSRARALVAAGVVAGRADLVRSLAAARRWRPAAELSGWPSGACEGPGEERGAPPLAGRRLRLPPTDRTNSSERLDTLAFSLLAPPPPSPLVLDYLAHFGVTVCYDPALANLCTSKQ